MLPKNNMGFILLTNLTDPECITVSRWGCSNQYSFLVRGKPLSEECDCLERAGVDVYHIDSWLLCDSCWL